MMKILNWIFRKYLRKYLSKRVIKLRNGKFIPDIEIVESNKAGSDILSRYQERIVHELTMEILKQGLIKIERQRNDEFSGEAITAEINIFKSQKDRGLDS